MNTSQPIYMSPKVVLNRINNIVTRCPHGLDNITRREHKEDREYLPVALLLMALKELDGRLRWLQSGEYIVMDSDVAVITQRGMDQEGLPILDSTIEHCQVTEFEGHSKTFIEVVKGKLKPGYDGRGANLVVNVREHPEWTFFPHELANDVSRLSPTYDSIWLICESENKTFNFHVIRLWPELFHTQFDALTSFDEDWFPDFVRASPKFITKIEAGLGEYQMELPICKKCASHRMRN